MPRRPAKTAYLLPGIPDRADDETKDGLAIRNACAVGGVCPDCGAVGEVTRDGTPGLYRLTFAHEPACRCLLDEDIA